MEDQKRSHKEEMEALKSNLDQKRSQEMKELKESMEESRKIPATIEEEAKEKPEEVQSHLITSQELKSSQGPKPLEMTAITH